VKLALWTPRAGRTEVAALVSELRTAAELQVVEAWPQQRPEAELDLYHLADEALHGFVYRALLERPGLVWLESPSLHTLVHAETAGKGDEAAYRREVRRAHGPRGAFVADQVLRGTGGALTTLLTLSDRVLESALAVLSSRDDVRQRLAGGLEAPVLAVPPLEAANAGEMASVVLGLLPALQGRLAEAALRLRDEREREATLAGQALRELRPFARELGLRQLPSGVEPLLAELFEPKRWP